MSRHPKAQQEVENRKLAGWFTPLLGHGPISILGGRLLWYVSDITACFFWYLKNPRLTTPVDDDDDVDDSSAASYPNKKSIQNFLSLCRLAQHKNCIMYFFACVFVVWHTDTHCVWDIWQPQRQDMRSSSQRGSTVITLLFTVPAKLYWNIYGAFSLGF